MLQTLRNAWKVEEIRKKLIFTALMFLVFRLGNAIPVPFINKELIAQVMQSNQGGLLDFLNMFSGGSLEQFSVFALSIGPYITASIVIQLLTIAIPQLEELSKEGEEGRKKIQKITRFTALLLAVIQGSAVTQGLFRNAIVAQGALQGAAIIITLVAGTMFLVWLADLITEHGVGNGTSMIIFVGIVSGLIPSIYQWIMGLTAGSINIIAAIAMLIIIIAIVALVVMINEGERKIPVQYAKRVVGRKMYGGQSTHIPIKVNMAGVMPVIFSSAILALPQTIALLTSEGVRKWITEYMTTQGTVGVYVYSIINIALIIMFAYFYTAVQFNTVEYAKNLQQYGGFIPGIRPGRPTSDFLSRISNRITIIGAVVLALLSSLPTILSSIFQLQIQFGGTAVIIVVGVVLETIKQLEAMLQMRHYKGFLNK